MKRILGLHGGSGGFGREVLEWALSTRRDEFDEIVLVNDFVEDSAEIRSAAGLKEISRNRFLNLSRAELNFTILIGDSNVRQRIWDDYIKAGVRPASLVAASAEIYTSVDDGMGAVFCPKTMVTTQSRIGKCFQGNIYSYIAHDCVIGDFVTFAPRVSCNGNVHIEDGAYIGTGAILKQGSLEAPLVIGKGAVVGMGAVVTKSVAPGTVVVGNPARPLAR